jgi:hypothetical protein
MDWDWASFIIGLVVGVIIAGGWVIFIDDDWF